MRNPLITRTSLLGTAALLCALSTGEAQGGHEAYNRAVEFVPGVNAGGIGVAAVLGTSEPWCMLRVLTSAADSGPQPAVFLLRDSSARFARDLRRIAGARTRGNSAASWASVTDELMKDKRTSLSGTRIVRGNEVHVVFRLATGDGGERTDASTEMTSENVLRVAAALERATMRPVAPDPLPSRWMVLYNLDDQTVYLDSQSLRRVSATSVEVWVRVHTHDAQQDQVMTAFFEFMCRARRYAMTSITIEDRNTLNSSKTPGPSDPSAKWRPLSPESTAERIATRACRIIKSPV